MNEEELRKTLEAREKGNLYWKISYGKDEPVRLLWDGEMLYPKKIKEIEKILDERPKNKEN